jgi:uncharacterized membrane protein SpoIIM required for sporulation
MYGRVDGVDVDAFAAVHEAEWDRFRELVHRRRLTGVEVDELVALYQLTATHLSMIQSSAPDPALVGRLSTLLARARVAIAGSHEPSWADVGEFVLRTLPAALYRVRWWTVAVAVVFCSLATVTGWWVAGTPDAQAALGTPAELRRYADEAFEAYYSASPAPSFAAQVWTNNAWIAAQCIGLGITGVFPVWVLGQNAVAVGAAAGVMAAYDRLGVFLGLILPHGLLELTAIFVAGGAGLRIFWAWVAPGPVPRGTSVAREARALVTVALGLVGVLAVAGLVEAFVTPAALPGLVKIGIGALVLVAFWSYPLTLGRRAVRSGLAGDLDEDRAGYVVPTAG